MRERLKLPSQRDLQSLGRAEKLQWLKTKRPWESDLPLARQFGSQEGEGFLMSIRDNPKLLLDAVLLTIPKTEDKKLVKIAGELAIDLHGNRKREDGETLHAMHVVRTAVRWSRLPDSTPMQKAILLLHDTKEDEGMKLKDLQNAMRPHGYEDNIIQTIFTVVDVFDKTGKSHNEYHRDLAAIDALYPDLRVFGLKIFDRDDSPRGDISLAKRTNYPPQAVARVNKSRNKSLLIPKYFEAEQPHLLHTYKRELAIAKEAINLGAEIVKKHGAK